MLTYGVVSLLCKCALIYIFSLFLPVCLELSCDRAQSPTHSSWDYLSAPHTLFVTLKYGALETSLTRVGTRQDRSMR